MSSTAFPTGFQTHPAPFSQPEDDNVDGTLHMKRRHTSSDSGPSETTARTVRVYASGTRTMGSRGRGPRRTQVRCCEDGPSTKAMLIAGIVALVVGVILLIVGAAMAPLLPVITGIVISSASSLCLLTAFSLFIALRAMGHNWCSTLR